jgi:hypothetical protein
MLKRTTLGITALLLILSSCRKVKLDNTNPLTGDQVGQNTGSSVRLFNFFNSPLDIKVNNISLTAFSSDPTAQVNQIGLSLFPSGVWASGDDGSPVVLPVSMQDKQSQFHVIIRPRGIAAFPGLGYLPPFNIDTVIVNDALHPRDYYAMADGHLRVIDRNSAAPTQSDHFKIRILNLGIPSDDLLGIDSTVVLTYADGTVVSPQLDTVARGRSSAYYELPYGSYQLKLYLSKTPGIPGMPDYTKQLAELPVYPDLSSGTTTPQTDLNTRVRGFKPGGTYSIVVTPNIFGYDLSNVGVPTYYLFNSYRILTEQAAPLNTTWARMQGVNATATAGISFKVDGQSMGTGLGSGQFGGYNTMVQGVHQVQAFDASGSVLATAADTLSPYDNITAWLYTKGSAQAIAFTNTDMTTTLYESVSSNVVDDGTDGSKNTWQFLYAFQSRFMNFSDVPYITYTQDGALFNPQVSGNSINESQSDTLAYPQAYINLGIGIPTYYNPFVVFPADNPPINWVITTNGQTYFQGKGNNHMGVSLSNPVPVRVFQSQPATDLYGAQVPGTLLANVAPLQTADFATGTQIYNGGPQRVENGFYTIALIGSLSGEPSNARLIVVKHNK